MQKGAKVKDLSDISPHVRGTLLLAIMTSPHNWSMVVVGAGQSPSSPSPGSTNDHPVLILTLGLQN